VAAKYILAALAVIFLVLGLTRIARRGRRAHPQSRTWLIVAVIFGAVSAWLFYQP
jgi:uncharacterized membrane protein HdeD (DUF308 family)